MILACGLGLYKQEHLLCVMGRPYCLSCYDDTLKTAKRHDVPADTMTIPPRTKDGRPAPPGRRRFAPPGLVIPTPQSTSSSTAPHRHSPPSPLSASITNVTDQPTPASSSSKAPDRNSVNHLTPAAISTELKGPRGQYRNTVRSLAERFEPPPSILKTPLSPVGASVLNRPIQDNVGYRSGTGLRKEAASRDTASRSVEP